jgi:hypothetical protein
MFLWGGVAILIVVAVAHIVPVPSGVLALPILVYFALGVALLSQGRFSVLHAIWERQGLPIQRALPWRWLAWAVVFLVAVALAALVLPTRYTAGPVRALMQLASLLYTGLSFLVALLLFLLALPIALLFPQVDAPPRPRVSAPPPPAVGGAPEAAAVPWLEVLGTALFWVVVLSILAYAVVRFLRDRFGGLEGAEAADGAWWQRLLLWLRALWRGWRGWTGQVQERLAQRRKEWAAERTSRAGRLSFFSLRRLAPRQLVRYFYLSAARRAAEAGQPRGPGQTPYEYQASLDQRFDDLEPELTGLTEAFIQAQYSRQPVDSQAAEEVKPLWQRIKVALRRRRIPRA